MRFTLKMLSVSVASLLLLSARPSSEFQEDFATAIEWITSTYAYFDAKATQWDDVPDLYGDDLQQVRNIDQFVMLLERVIEELYDPHAHLNVNLADSPRLVPSGADLWAEWQNGRATITQIRDGSDAARVGIKLYSQVISINGVPINDAVEARLGRSYPHAVDAARDWALRAVLAGNHNTPRVLAIQEGEALRMIELPATNRLSTADTSLTVSEIRPGIGYIRLNDSLGEETVVAAFDHALNAFHETRGLIVDLRNTPSGGVSSVARGILGRFVDREQPHQMHVLPAAERNTGVRRSWLELVSPRGEFMYSQPVVVLVGRWTGSMGEGLAIGFDATGSGIVVGTAMAGLVGATYGISLPYTRIGISIPAERLYHVNGTPREAFQPTVAVDISNTESEQDPFITTALGVLLAQ